MANFTEFALIRLIERTLRRQAVDVRGSVRTRHCCDSRLPQSWKNNVSSSHNGQLTQLQAGQALVSVQDHYGSFFASIISIINILSNKQLSEIQNAVQHNIRSVTYHIWYSLGVGMLVRGIDVGPDVEVIHRTACDTRDYPSVSLPRLPCSRISAPQITLKIFQSLAICQERH
ncbi:hypothetical protein CBL_02732 [Carabus blaptoides fortunei]